jgi:hypothetical protein
MKTFIREFVVGNYRLENVFENEEFLSSSRKIRSIASRFPWRSGATAGSETLHHGGGHGEGYPRVPHRPDIPPSDTVLRLVRYPYKHYKLNTFATVLPRRRQRVASG